MPVPSLMERLSRRLLKRDGSFRESALSRWIDGQRGRVYREPAVVVDDADQVLEMARSAGDHHAEARILRLRAHGWRAGNHYDRALADYRRSSDLFRREKRPVDALINEIGTIDALMYLGRYADARRTALRARRRFAAAGDVSRRARVETNLGNIHHRRDEPREALEWYDRALSSFRQLREKDSMALVEFNRGNTLTVLGRPKGARAAYQAALDIVTKRGAPGRLRQIRYNLSYLDFMENRFPESLDELARLRPDFEASGDRRHSALCRLDESEILLRLNLWDEAGVLAGEARRGFTELRMGYEAAKSGAFLGASSYRLGDLDGAEREVRAASRLFRSEGNRMWRGEMALFMARIHLERGHWSRALTEARSARGLLLSSPWSGGSVRAAVVGALALRGLGRRGPARRLLETKALSPSRDGSPWLVMETMETAGLLAQEAGDLPTARKRFRSAIRAVEGLRAMLTGDDFRAAFLRDRDRPYLALAALELSASRPRQAFRILERGRSRALLDILAAPASVRRSRRRRDLERKAFDLLGRLGSRYHQIDLAREKGVRSHLGSATESGETLQMLETQATRILRRLSKGPRRNMPTLETGVSDVQKLLRSDETMVAYFERSGHLGAFLVTRDSFGVHTDLASVNEVDAIARNLRFQWGRFRLDPNLLQRHGSQIHRLARADLEALHSRMLGSLPRPPETKRLIIVPTASTRTVPFGALFDGRRHLVEERIVSITPGAAVFAACRKRSGKTDSPLRRPLFVGVSDERAPEVAREIEDLLRAIPNARALRQDDATVERFRAESKSASLIHLAAHGLFRADRPNLSGIRLADRWLYGYDVAELSLDADLVTLSACATGESAAWGQGEWMGLARSFLIAGGRRILVGLWDVHDAATRHLMAAFYGNLAAEETPDIAAALARVQGDFARSGAHPYYWSGFLLVGDS